MSMSNKVYDVLKVIALIALPLAEFITAIGNIFNLPFCSQIVAVLVAANAFLGAILKVSSDNYHKEDPDAE